MNDQAMQYNIIYETEIFTKDILLLTSKNGALFSSVDVKGCRISATLVFTSVLITELSLVDYTVSISLKQNIYFLKRIEINFCNSIQTILIIKLYLLHLV